MKKAKLAASLIAVSMAATTLLTGCNNDTPSPSGSGNSSSSNTSSTSNGGNTGGGDTKTDSSSAPELKYANGTELRVAAGYNSVKTGITFDAETAGAGVTLADGKTYQAGDLKPTWQELEKRLNMKFKSVYQGNSATNEFDYWKEQLDQVDIVAGSATQLTENGNAGNLVDLSKYLDSMPNFKKYLEEKSIVRLSITGSTTGSTKGAIYFSPYFDGVNDIERMPLMRTDWVEKLLNGDGKFEAASSDNIQAPVYQPYMPTSGKVDIDVVKADGSGTEKVTKDYDKAGNIVKKMNDAGAMSGVEAVNMLRDYIDQAYNGYYGTNRADLFIGQNAAWDADELVALLRCVVANSATLNASGKKVAGLFSREDGNNQRKVDLFRFAGTLFGVRGLESRQDYLYVGNDKQLHDARMEEDTYVALEKMHDLAEEGLIASDYLTCGGEGSSGAKSSQYVKEDAGFMSYDYNQTQTIFNEQDGVMDDGEVYRAVMVPVAAWKDGADDKVTYMRFTESWRSVKTDGWAISIKGVGDSTDKLNAALKLIDYAYSPEGQILMSYGPDAFIKMNGDKYSYFKFNGEDWPEIADATRTELWEKASGNYTNYARMYLGSTLSFLKSQAFEYQCTTEAGRLGAGYISNAIAYGTIKHPELALTSNAWYTSVPTVLPLTKTESDEINSKTQLGSKGVFSTSKTDKGGSSIFVDIIKGGYAGEGTTSRAETISSVKDAWGGESVLEIRNIAWESLVDFYNG